MIIQKSKIKLKQPIVFYSWPSIGMIGNYVINYLISQLQASVLAEIEIEEYIVPQSSIIEKGIIYSTPYISDKIFYSRQKHSDFVFIAATYEPASFHFLKFTQEIINFFQQLQASLIITFSALPSYILHTDYPKLYIARTSNDIKLFNEIEILNFGSIEGTNGVLLALAKESNINGICIFCEIPFYTTEMVNPQAAFSILKVLKDIFLFEVDFTKLYEDIKIFDEKIKNILTDINKKTQRFFKQLNMDTKQNFLKRKQNLTEETSGITFEELKKQIKFSLPQSAKNRINELFKLASENIKYAKQLKEELDKWGVYKEYEDKFLLLFLKNKKQDMEE
ncbi:MAG: PAC2 family protein [Elusimicrobiota bacterium]|nr:PAC2 family protein [Endomicrobiia bacterium]MDW8165414.1 PAC2 family protein [Elusimicrobiota bacterium]